MYNDKAFEILKSSINSAVFIDEKAKEFFSGTSVNPDIAEEQLSVDLFKTFKESGKSLVVHKFEAGNLEDSYTLDYLFKGKDLILLDWELAEVAGQEHSLNLLNKAINAPYINFCCIYSSSNSFNEIPFFLDTYFSGLNGADFELIKNNYDYINPDEISLFWNVKATPIDEFFQENSIDLNDFPIEEMRNHSPDLILRYIYLSLTIEKYIINETALNGFEVLNSGIDSFIINNTFVLTLKKDFQADAHYASLLRRISDNIVKNKGSFFQLLGLEMQSVFNSNERFIDETILKSSTEALFQFRNHINDDKTFGIIIKKLLIEQATLKLRTAKLQLLDSDFLSHQSGQITQAVTNEDLFQLNVFYNSVTVNSLNNDDVPNLNFGDVLKDSDRNYYLCITALCDCYEPNKIQHNFYFVKGTPFKDSNMALKLGDAGFVSFLPNNTVVYWGDLESVKPIKITQDKGESIDQYRIRKLTNEIDAYKNFLYKPFYIKPKVYNVQNNKLIDNKIRIWDITNKNVKEDFNQNLNFFDVEYVTTLRNDYAQRIANHAFGHPARVGVDFVKIK